MGDHRDPRDLRPRERAMTRLVPLTDRHKAIREACRLAMETGVIHYLRYRPASRSYSVVADGAETDDTLCRAGSYARPDGYFVNVFENGRKQEIRIL